MTHEIHEVLSWKLLTSILGPTPKDPLYKYQVCAEQGQHTPGEIVKCLKSLWVVHLMNIRLNLSWLPITGKFLKQSYSTQQRWRNIKIIPWLLGLSLSCSCSWIPNNLNIQYNESAIIITHKGTPATGVQGSCIIRGLEETDSQINFRTHRMVGRHLPSHQGLTFKFLGEVPIHNTTLPHSHFLSTYNLQFPLTHYFMNSIVIQAL